MNMHLTDADLLPILAAHGLTADALPAARAITAAVAERAGQRIAELCDAVAQGERSLDEMHLPVFDLQALHDIANGAPLPARAILRRPGETA